MLPQTDVQTMDERSSAANGRGAGQRMHKQWLGLAPEDHIVALLYLGYPAIPRTERRPIPFADKTTWML